MTASPTKCKVSISTSVSKVNIMVVAYEYYGEEEVEYEVQ